MSKGSIFSVIVASIVFFNACKSSSNVSNSQNNKKEPVYIMQVGDKKVLLEDFIYTYEKNNT